MSEVNIEHNGVMLNIIYTGHGSDLTVDGVYDATGEEIIFPNNSEEFLSLYQEVLDSDAESMNDAADFLHDHLSFTHLG